MKIEQVKEQYEAQLMELPNVIGVGVGERGGSSVIKVFVTQKVAESFLKPEEIIPKRLNQFDVDVEEIGNLMAGTE